MHPNNQQPTVPNGIAGKALLETQGIDTSLSADQRFARQTLQSTMSKNDMEQAIKQKQAVLHSKDPKGYLGHDTAREYDKFVANEIEKRGDNVVGNKAAIENVDKRAARRLLAANHKREDVQKTIGNRSLNSLGKSTQEKSAYGQERTTAAVRSSRDHQRVIVSSKALRTRQNVPDNDCRLQSMEVARRQDVIDQTKNVNSLDRVLETRSGKAVNSGDIYRSNHQERTRQIAGETPERRDIELSKTHLTNDARSISHTGKVLGSQSPDVAREHYSHRQQQQLGQARAAEGFKQNIQKDRPENTKHKLNNERYVASEAQYRAAQQHIQKTHGHDRSR